MALRLRVFTTTICALSIVNVLEGGQQQQPPVPPAPSAASPYDFLYVTGGRTRSAAFDAARRSLPYESISISRRGCFGECPIYSVTLRLDGTATYSGERFVDRVGKYSGKVFLGDFAQLASFVDRSGFMKLGDRYTAPWTDDETVIVSVVPRVGTGKTVSDYGRLGPPDLWVLEQAIDGVVAQIKWAPQTP